MISELQTLCLTIIIVIRTVNLTLVTDNFYNGVDKRPRFEAIAFRNTCVLVHVILSNLLWVTTLGHTQPGREVNRDIIKRGVASGSVPCPARIVLFTSDFQGCCS